MQSFIGCNGDDKLLYRSIGKLSELNINSLIALLDISDIKIRYYSICILLNYDGADIIDLRGILSSLENEDQSIADITLKLLVKHKERIFEYKDDLLDLLIKPEDSKPLNINPILSELGNSIPEYIADCIIAKQFSDPEIFNLLDFYYWIHEDSLNIIKSVIYCIESKTDIVKEKALGVLFRSKLMTSNRLNADFFLQYIDKDKFNIRIIDLAVMNLFKLGDVGVEELFRLQYTSEIDIKSIISNAQLYLVDKHELTVDTDILLYDVINSIKHLDDNKYPSNYPISYISLFGYLPLIKETSLPLLINLNSPPLAVFKRKGRENFLLCVFQIGKHTISDSGYSPNYSATV